MSSGQASPAEDVAPSPPRPEYGSKTPRSTLRRSSATVVWWVAMGHGVEEDYACLMELIPTLPANLARSHTWDQGREMGPARHLHRRSGVRSGDRIAERDYWLSAGRRAFARSSPGAVADLALTRLLCRLAGQPSPTVEYGDRLLSFPRGSPVSSRRQRFR